MKRTAKVADIYEYWGKPPPARSARCSEWVQLINSGWKPNRRLGMMGYDCASEYFGVYVWEYINVIHPLLHEKEVERASK